MKKSNSFFFFFFFFFLIDIYINTLWKQQQKYLEKHPKSFIFKEFKKKLNLLY